jgi:hypothetical protein
MTFLNAFQAFLSTTFIEYYSIEIVIYEPSAGRRCSRMSAFFKARATKERGYEYKILN